MKVTNKFKIPIALVRAVQNDGYSSGNADYSVTTLLKPARMVALERQHKDELEEDASDRIWSLLGQLMHSVLERAAMEGEVEQRHTIEVLGKKISGAIDLYLDGVIQDYKLTTVWKVLKGVPLEYEQQLNCYAYILRTLGRSVSGLQLVCVLRDWSKMEALRNPEYPQSQVVLLDVKLWDVETQKTFIEERVRAHVSAGVTLPECTPEERWATEDKFAVTKNGNKKASRLFNSSEEAVNFAEGLGGASVQFRPGESKRCNYCPVKNFCEQRKKMLERGEK